MQCALRLPCTRGGIKEKYDPGTSHNLYRYTRSHQTDGIR